MTIETGIVLLIVIVAFLVVSSIRRKKKSTAILTNLVTSPSPIVSDPPVINIESKEQDDRAEAAINNEPLLSSNSEEDIEEKGSDTAFTEPESTVEESEITRRAEQMVVEFGLYDPQLDLASYHFPPLEILNTEISAQAVTEEEMELQKQKLAAMFEIWRLGIQNITAIAGPRSILYEVVPALGVRIAQIKQTENDLVLALGVSGTKVIGHLLGRGTVGIEVPYKKPSIVSIYSLLNSPDFKKTKLDLPIVLGLTIFNEVYIADLATLPHLLISGATGQGKSVAINTLILSLLYKKHPAEIKFILIDVNSLELNLYSTLERHFLAKISDENAIITEVHKVTPIISSLMVEMEERYNLLKKAQVRSIKEYNEKFTNRKLTPTDGNRYLPYLIIIIDEFSRLMINDEHNSEALIDKLAQQGRPVGIHLVVSTQYAAAKIITGGVKANFPARMAFRVSSTSDSDAILDQAGAEKLGGDGDMLFADGANVVRLQSPFVSTAEVKAVTNYIQNQRGYPTAFLLPDDPGKMKSNSRSPEFDPTNRDALFEEAAKLIVMHQQGSTSLIQRKLKLNYNRAGRIIDQLEAAGVVGPFEGSKAREVLLHDDYSLEQFLKKINKN